MRSLFTIDDWLEPVLIPVSIRKLSIACHLSRQARLPAEHSNNPVRFCSFMFRLSPNLPS